jgi:hypothetical protein
VKKPKPETDQPDVPPTDVLQLSDQLEHSLAFAPEDTVDPTASYALLKAKKERTAKNKLMFRTLDDSMASSVEPVRVQERRGKLLNKFSPASYLKHLEKHREARRKKGLDARIA